MQPLPLLLYRHGSAVLRPLSDVFLARRVKAGKEDPKRLDERRGGARRARPDGPLAWLHGASVGETVALLPLVERLAAREMAVLVTSGTITSARVLERRLPPGSIHQFAPLDFAAFGARFLDHWRPDIAIFAESELWPNLILEAKARAIPLLLVNGRMSERSFRRWRKLSGSIGALLGRFDQCLAQSPADAQRLSALGAPAVSVAGNLKYDVAPPPADPLKLSALRGAMAGRPVWIAASTHQGEEEQAGQAHLALAGRHAGLMTIIAPRHPQRGGEVAKALAAMGLTVALRSKGAAPGPGTQIYVADTIGELGLFYRIASLVFMGGSLAPHGGQNPIEPAKLGAAVLHGPHVHNFADVFAALDQAGAALPVADARDLARRLDQLLADGAAVRAMARRAGETVDGLAGATDRIMRRVEGLLPPRALAET